MDHRAKSFKQKFADAATEFGVMPENIISLKFRDQVGSYRFYRELLADLRENFGIQHSEINGNLQGNGFLLNDKGSKVILVEHETGLEILYIAGSIASLICIIPLIMRSWGFIRTHFYGKQLYGSNSNIVEIRYLDSKGALKEEHISDLERMFAHSNPGLLYPSPLIANIIENDYKLIINKLQDLTLRVESLERDYKKQRKVQKVGVAKKDK
jgi:hypothetical protein